MGGEKSRKLCILDTVSIDEPTLKIVDFGIFSTPVVWISWSSSLLPSSQNIWQAEMVVFRLSLLQFHRETLRQD